MEPEAGMKAQARYEARVRVVKAMAHPTRMFIVDELSRSNSIIEGGRQVNYRATFEWWPLRTMRWRTRIEHVGVSGSASLEGSSGYLFFQDVRLKPSSKFSIEGRAIVFESQSYASRIYEYESELRGTFVNPALYGNGIRSYLMATNGIGGVQLSIKYSATIKPGLRTLSSGSAEIDGDTDNRVSAQVEVTY